MRPETAHAARVVGAPVNVLGDAYHKVLRMSWAGAGALLSGAFVAVNCVFGAVYAAVGGVANAQAGSMTDGFFFSVQTLSTVGYGKMYPESVLAGCVATAEALLGLAITALVTGVVFAKFSQAAKHPIVFARAIAVSEPEGGVPRLRIRLGNWRGNYVMNAEVSASAVFVVRDGESFLYEARDLKLERPKTSAVWYSWEVTHAMDRDSPLFGYSRRKMALDRVSINVSMTGTDENSLQPIQAQYSYGHSDVLWGARHADLMVQTRDELRLDLGRFHEVVRDSKGGA